MGFITFIIVTKLVNNSTIFIAQARSWGSFSSSVKTILKLVYLTVLWTPLHQSMKYLKCIRAKLFEQTNCLPDARAVLLFAMEEPRCLIWMQQVQIYTKIRPSSLSCYHFCIHWSVLIIDYKCEDGRFSVPARCVTISNPNSLSSCETGVNPGLRSWNARMWLSSMSGSHWWHLFHKEVKTWESTSWF